MYNLLKIVDKRQRKDTEINNQNHPVLRKFFIQSPP